MKAKLASLIAVPLLALSSVTFAQETAQPVPAEPMMLSMSQMDGVTAGFLDFDIDFHAKTININVNFGDQNIGNIGGHGGTGAKYFLIGG